MHGLKGKKTDFPKVEIVIEIPKGSFLKRGSQGTIDFISPLPCPFNYGSVPKFLGGEGDLLDAVVLGPRLACGTRVTATAYGSVGLAERFMYDDKLICSFVPVTKRQQQKVLAFFSFYACCKEIRNRLLGRQGKSYCTGWGSAEAALARACPVTDYSPRHCVPF